LPSPDASFPTVVLDCRWLGIGGPGRTTELVLRGLAHDPPETRWRLWGAPARIGPLAWPGAEIVATDEDPRRLLGQRHAFAVPAGDVVAFMHQVRPLRNLPSVTLIYDTIPLRYGASAPARQLKRTFFRRVASTTRRILTISDFSRASIVRDLGVSEARIDVLRFPFAADMAARVQALQASLPTSGVALFVGGFLPHKNLPRLVQAFEASGFRREGGRLVLAGGTPSQAQELRGRLTPAQRAFTEVREACSQPDLDRLFATSLFLVQPSLEEGFGLPAWEALCCGLPVCASDGGALPEVVHGMAEPFAATSVPAMSAAIDACASRARASTVADRLSLSEGLRRRAPTVAEFGRQFRSIVEGEASAMPRRKASRR
jgi:glycosyltransferase involved in cell wall biosynthesis